MKEFLLILIKRLNIAYHKRGFKINKIFFPLYWYFFEKLRATKPIMAHVGRLSLLGYPSDTIFSDMVVRGAYENFETKLFKKLLKVGITMVDIGAYIGYYSLIASKIVGDSGKVYAFEPEQANYDLLVRNVHLNHCHNINCLQLAVSDHAGRLPLYVDKFDLGTHSLSRKNVIHMQDSTYVDSTSIDEFFLTKRGVRIDIIKIDVQGAEEQVIKGAKNMLERDHPKIFMEFWPFGLKNMGEDPARLLRLLRKYGYRLNLINEKNKLFREIDDLEIIEYCGLQDKSGRGYANLLAE